ncbi:alpha-1,3-mannosyl-glycoprotein 4-beta-N-acetylglucosaminyltransferase-like protein MGAT4E [Lingula anatina]|uniref:Alpha-1,3-mannosyl-glycoprotein 4-beta-N-acetylglucosaminyltransferase-like protein MGAT4E n=1 Tax=Lingula anatina TaxID=7574 RepID=A0A1S3JDJ3_LINAN|nr:alpha-1,3-mannosyl-glycoprotein 4-beta-N-acetylglucosaminyltransferase-like protein MGAT4E [Lingula anatina]|eukprot:XP_013408485.1 alpha-1,3-mannosyl-glycoprotein 4-beta-N-acetylglucosaminyltransferase-like protein MGAT4E [Lingula anatina]
MKIISMFFVTVATLYVIWMLNLLRRYYFKWEKTNGNFAREGPIPSGTVVLPLSYWSHSAKLQVVGRQRAIKGFQTIGILMNEKDGKDKIMRTINSLIEETTEKDQMETVVLIFLSVDQSSNFQILKEIISMFPTYMSSGFLQVIYRTNPSDTNATSTLESWQKDNIDYGMLIMFAQRFIFSKYFLFLEYNVTCSPGFVFTMKMDVEFYSKLPWMMLQFSQLKLAGRFYHYHDLHKLLNYLWIFHQKLPPEALVELFVDIRGNAKSTGVRKRNLFQYQLEENLIGASAT